MTTRVDELQRKYPTVPREVIIKFETLTKGISDSPALGEIGYWARSGISGTYQSYDRGMSLDQLAKKGPDVVRPGFVKRLGAFHFKSGNGVRIDRDFSSPYQIRKSGSGQFALYEGEKKVEDVYFPNIPWPFTDEDEPVTSKGTPITALVNLASPTCYHITPVRHCEYFNTGEECRFCNYNATQSEARSFGALNTVTVNLDETVEAFKILASSVRLMHGGFQMGGLTNSEREVQIFLDFADRLASTAPYARPSAAGTQPMSRMNMQRLKDVGFRTVAFGMEVWERELFAEICPGKARRDGYDRYLEAFQEAVDIFGAGHVSCSFVAGATLMPPNGFKAWQESRDSLIEGVRWMTKHGVEPHMVMLRLGLGSPYGNDKSNVAKLPPTEFHIETALAHDEAMAEAGLYEKRKPPCPLHSFYNHYHRDLGDLRLAGSFRNLVAAAIPDKTNWLARFILSMESPTRAG